MSQASMEMPDGLRAPFYANVWRYGVEMREDEDTLHDLLSWTLGAIDAGECFVREIGDAEGVLWSMSSPGWWRASDRAPWPTPEEALARSKR